MNLKTGLELTHSHQLHFVPKFKDSGNNEINSLILSSTIYTNTQSGVFPILKYLLILYSNVKKLTILKDN